MAVAISVTAGIDPEEESVAGVDEPDPVSWAGAVGSVAGVSSAGTAGVSQVPVDGSGEGSASGAGGLSAGGASSGT
ncbi:hypothetical protein MJO55_29050 [Mycolicibacterium rufum]|uniref:Uncharacterized protein n=1 Tax=Mycolicibacterium rufum TaxID=318424 RepID=A0ABY5TVU9_9MYCO|nr:hypothetical protein [Mycolicibacterium rufum]UVY95899.1 hypothetical protein MJO55_29050 [Mycolicibacterium rufum]